MALPIVLFFTILIFFFFGKLKKDHFFHVRKLSIGCSLEDFPVGIYMLKVNNKNTRTRYEICSKSTIKTPGAFIDNFEHISHPVLVFP